MTPAAEFKKPAALGWLSIAARRASRREDSSPLTDNHGQATYYGQGGSPSPKWTETNKSYTNIFQHHSHLYDGGDLCGGRKQNSNTTSACTMAAGAYQHHAPARSSSLGCSLARSLSHSLANPTFPLPTPGVQVHVSDAQVRNRSA